MSSTADLVLYLHFAYVAAVVLPVPLIALGGRLGWRWVRHRGLRITHLAMMGVVFAEAALGVACPLTWLEAALRGEVADGRGFLSYWVSRILFHELHPLIFVAGYCAFFALIAALWMLVPPIRRRAR